MSVLSNLEIYVNGKILWGMLVRHIFLIQVWITSLLLTKIMLCKEAKIIKKILLYIQAKKLKLAIQNAEWH